ncbi:MAG TPA: AzlD domain-containing protein [Paracoccus sp. (in: a-proteobacteria)]|uniref:AzlD domain-containing protein n=1 Tax=Paracoccus sp. TaxID=267 RepID=UPI002BFC5449|nr:AzlD domain-containing protein [Paracoccus sp. (in: a-proteobacteria)]HWL57053.1 AzlD domain-containing protein [Paracoccus sp. (in: a-proteobacteria)]
MSGFDMKVWFVILTLGIGTYLIRWSFLGVIGKRPVPEWAARALRYTAVAVLPAIAAPLVVWPAATGGQPDPVRLSAAAVALATGIITRNVLLAIVAGMVTLFGMLYLWA